VSESWPVPALLMLGELALLLFAFAVVAASWAAPRVVRALRRSHQRLRRQQRPC
jgi:hypothetical protein